MNTLEQAITEALQSYGTLETERVTIKVMPLMSRHYAEACVNGLRGYYATGLTSSEALGRLFEQIV
jgi:hypothetical protein